MNWTHDFRDLHENKHDIVSKIGKRNTRRIYHKKKEHKNVLLKIFNIFLERINSIGFTVENDEELKKKYLRSCWIHDKTLKKSILKNGGITLVVRAVIDIEDHRDHHHGSEVNMICTYRVVIQPYKNDKKLKSIGVITPSIFDQDHLEEGWNFINEKLPK